MGVGLCALTRVGAASQSVTVVTAYVCMRSCSVNCALTDEEHEGYARPGRSLALAQANAC